MSDNREQILAAIQVQGDLVRTLKTAKEPKSKVIIAHTNYFTKTAFIFYKL